MVIQLLLATRNENVSFIHSV